MDNSSNIYEGITNTATISLDTLILNGVEISSISSNIPSGVNIYDYLQWDGTQYITSGSNNKNVFGKNSNPVHTGINMLNATGSIINTQQNNSFYLAPLRNIQLNSGFLLYDFTSKEISYSLTVPSFTTSDITISNLTASKLVLTNDAKRLITSSYGITDIPILSQNNTFTGLNTFSLGSVSSPSIRWDSDTGFYSTGNGNIDVAVNGTRRLGITDRIRTYGYVNSTVVGSASNPNYAFDPDNDTGMYQGSTTGELNFSCNSTQILSMNSSEASFKKSIRTEQGLVSNPSYSFTVDSDTGMYQSTGANIDFCCNGQNQLNISLQGIKVPSLTASKIVLSDSNQRLTSSIYNITDFYTQSEILNLSTLVNYYTKSQTYTQAEILALNTLTNYYTKSQTYTQAEILALNTLTNYYTKSQTYTQAEILALNTLTNYYTKSQTYTQAEILALSTLTNYYTKSQTYTQAEITTLLNQKAGLTSNNTFSGSITISPSGTLTLNTPTVNLSYQQTSKMLKTDGSKILASSFYDEGDIQGYISQNFDLYKLQQTTTFSFSSNNTNTISVTSISTGSIFKGLTISSVDIYLSGSFQFVGSISGTTLTVTLSNPRIQVGCIISGQTIVGGTKIISGSGNTWTVNFNQTASSQTITVLYISYTNVVINSRGTGSGGLGTYIINQTMQPGTATNVSTGNIITTLFLTDTQNYAIDGSNIAPSYTFDNDSDTGIYRSVANQIDFSCGGVRQIYMNTTGMYSTNRLYLTDGTSSSPSLCFSNDTSSGIFSIGVGNINWAVGGTNYLNFNLNALNLYTSFRAQNGSSTIPSISFYDSTNTGLYRTGNNDLNMTVNGTRHFNIDTSGDVYIGTGTGTGTVTATVNGGIYIGNNTGNSNTKAGTIFTPLAIGYQAAQKQQGSYTVAIGRDAGRYGQGDYAVAIGYGAGQGVDGGQGQHNNSIIINAGTAIINSNGTNRCFINPLRNSPSNLTAVQYDTTTKELVTFGSTKRIKKNIQQKTNFDVDSILKLNIVEFDSIEDDSHNPCGLIAEDCYQINEEFVCLDSEGIPVSVNYFTLMLYSIEKNKRQEIEIQKLNEEVKTLKNTIEQITIYLQNNSTFVLNKN